jgi:enamine deaminase RidA (YjgF/YER057c/UK114 family)
VNSDFSRKKISSDAPWEAVVGYSRAVQAGNTIYVSGTTATGPEGKIVGLNDPYTQTKQIIENIEAALKKLDADLTNIVRTRIYTTNIRMWEQIAKAHREAFDKIRPVTTMVEVRALISEEILVEIEAEAVV